MKNMDYFTSKDITSFTDAEYTSLMVYLELIGYSISPECKLRDALEGKEVFVAVDGTIVCMSRFTLKCRRLFFDCYATANRVWPADLKRMSDLGKLI